MEIKGYKGFNPGLICKGKQYAENTTFEETEASICRSGMHFCQNPMDVLEYYPFVNSDGEFNEFAEVTADGDTKTDGNKSCTTAIIKRQEGGREGAEERTVVGKGTGNCMDHLNQRSDNNHHATIKDVTTEAMTGRRIWNTTTSRIFSADKTFQR